MQQKHVIPSRQSELKLKVKIQLEVEKKQFIDEIKKIKKEEIFPEPKKQEKLTLWKRIKKTIRINYKVMRNS